MNCWKVFQYAQRTCAEMGIKMEEVGNSRVALIGILVENTGETAQLNEILHEYAPYIIGRMGVPYAKKEVNIISVAVDAPEAKISALSGRLGMLDGVSTKVIYAKK